MTNDDRAIIQEEIQKGIKEYFNRYPTPVHTHNGIDSIKIDYNNLLNAGVLSKFATISKGMSDASSTSTIPHGLGRKPTFLKATGMVVAGTGFTLTNYGTYDGTNQTNIFFSKNGANPQANLLANYIQIFSTNISGTENQIGVASWDATNIYIAWTKNGNPSGNFYVLLEYY